jgi:hypothetical protein
MDGVSVVDETALIVWDEAAKVEHFIRRANFVSTGYDFGFLVPTPSKPELEVADPSLFSDLAEITKPKTEYREESRLNFGCAKSAPGMTFESAATPSGAVVVLEQKKVGDLDAAVLGFRPGAGDDPKEAAVELLAWLNRHQYAVRPELEEWLVPYVKNHWVITAFKIAAPVVATPAAKAKGTARSVDPPGTKNLALQSTPVRMSFSTDRPVYPYREPADLRKEKSDWNPRLLRVFVAAKQRMTGTLGTGTQAWPGRTVWANALLEVERANVSKKMNLQSEPMSRDWWLTEIEDHSSPRPGTDEVYFDPSADRSAIARPPQVIMNYREPEWVGPVCIGVPVLVAAVLALLIGYQLRRIHAEPREDLPPAAE